MSHNIEPGTEGAVRPPGPLVTTGFHPLAAFAGFGPPEVGMLRELGGDLGVNAGAIAGSVCSYLGPRLPWLGIAGADLDRDVVEEWLALSATGPFDGEFAARLRGITHVGGGATFPGLSVALRPQMVVGLLAWLQGEILSYLADVSDTVTLSGVGGVWMDLLVLQLGIMLEPALGSRTGAAGRAAGRGGDDVAGGHPCAALAGLGAAETRTLAETSTFLAPAVGGLLPLVAAQVLSRPEAGGDVEDPQLTIATMGWAQLRLMTVLNTVSFDPAGAQTFGELGDPGVLAGVGTAWMRMLTLRLGTLIEPYLSDPAVTTRA